VRKVPCGTYELLIAHNGKGECQIALLRGTYELLIARNGEGECQIALYTL